MYSSKDSKAIPFTLKRNVNNKILNAFDILVSIVYETEKAKRPFFSIGAVNPWSQKPITTEEEYDEYLWKFAYDQVISKTITTS